MTATREPLLLHVDPARFVRMSALVTAAEVFADNLRKEGLPDEAREWCIQQMIEAVDAWREDGK